ncbi:MAG: class II glutamine amidotransferase [Crenarchaeota archaeon]|nr:class II glutamine amidotransferase [Thermoproteota archaeon]MCR8488524.1 class II glutamine amidotransferase [Thermoproteota archaeon]
MCKMLGLVSNLETYIGPSYEILVRILRQLCEGGDCHGDGSGFAWYGANGWDVKKTEKPLWESKELGSFIAYTRSVAMIIHARRSSYPAISLQGPRVDNSHPFLAELFGFKWVFAHNGAVDFRDDLYRLSVKDKVLEYRGRVYKLESYGIDSEIFFRILLHTIEELGEEEPKSVPAALRRMLTSDMFRRIHALNFIMGSNKYLYAFRFCDERYAEAGKYSLYYLKRTGLSEAGRILLRRPNEVNLIISSEPFTSDKWIGVAREIKKDLPTEDWIPLENGEILIVPIGKPDKATKEAVL